MLTQTLLLSEWRYYKIGKNWKGYEETGLKGRGGEEKLLGKSDRATERQRDKVVRVNGAPN